MFRDNHQYGKYRLLCGGSYINSWYTQEIKATGGFTDAYVADPGFTYSCPAVSAGQWSRYVSTGNHLSLSGGVLAASVLGINLSLDTNWDSAHILYYHLVANGKVCGDNDFPSYASRMRTTR